MKAWIHSALVVALILGNAFAQTKKTGVLDSADLKTVVPANYFFDGLVASVQSRNSGAVRFDNGKLLIAAFVDNSGYSSDVQAKYQGLFITETNLDIGGTELHPGQYGFGFTKDGNFVILNVAVNQLVSTSFETDNELKRPVPLKLAADGTNYRLYAGKKYVVIKLK